MELIFYLLNLNNRNFGSIEKFRVVENRLYTVPDESGIVYIYRYRIVFRGGPFDFFLGGVEDSDCARIFFPTRGTRQILFSCKSAAQDIFPQYISRQNIFFALSYSYRQRRSWGFQSEEAEK